MLKLRIKNGAKKFALFFCAVIFYVDLELTLKIILFVLTKNKEEKQ